MIFFIALLTNPVLSKLPFEIEADNIKLENKNQELYASGDVIIRYKNYTFQSNKAIYLKQKRSLQFQEKVKLKDQNNNLLLADNIEINLESEVGLISNGYIKTTRDYHINAKKIYLKKDHIELLDCQITTCTAKKPEWYFKSDQLNIEKETSLMNSSNNVIYFYNFPIFYIPSFSQSFSNEEITNRPTPEFGYNQIDFTYGNIYLGYVLSSNISGKIGVGASEKRGFRYGLSHIYTPNQNQSLTLKSFHIEKTGFEGGLSYQWTNSETDSLEPIIAALFIPSENKKINLSFFADYTYDNIYFNELFHAIPSFRMNADNINFYFDSTLSGSISSGYYQDRTNKGNRHQLLVNLGQPVYKLSETSRIETQFLLKDNYYQQNKMEWRRLLNSTSFKFDILNTKNRLTYTKLLTKAGKSPFIFDTINEITDDEISTLSEINLKPLILAIESNYQINLKTFRNFKYSAHWVFQCWQIDLDVNTVWQEISLGISIPNL